MGIVSPISHSILVSSQIEDEYSIPFHQEGGGGEKQWKVGGR